ncbi:MAG: methyltransferase type 11 [Caulobacteraceae bacterium]|nr:MAG: methyltransferase type 11 [Caulobacteraceae bacterium]
MPLRPFLISSLCAVAALTAACDGDRSVRISSTRTDNSDAKGVLKVVDALQCPQTLGSLTRKGTASDGGRVCTYVGPKGAEVILNLVSLDGATPPQALKAFEERLTSSLPLAAAGLQADAARAQADAAQADADAAQIRADAAQAHADAAAGGDRASVRAPGLAVDAQDDKASVRLPGMRIDADGENASVRIGGFHIDANDSTGTVDIQGSDSGDNVSVRARNDATEVRAIASGEATRASWILTDNRPSAEGWRLVGYEARGPVGGPLVVATVRSRDRNRGRVFDDARELVTLNVGE